MIGAVFQRRTTGSVVCPSCGSLVGVRDDKCYMCGRANPGLWGFAPALRQLGTDFGFVPLVISASATLYVLTLLMSGSDLQVVGGGGFSFLSPSTTALFMYGAPFTVGASASIFGLLGALVHYGRKSGSSLIRGEAMRYAVILFVFGLIMPGVDNYAHAGGFLGGYATSAFFNPMTRERGDHLILAIGCLVATFLAILFSILHGLQGY